MSRPYPARVLLFCLSALILVSCRKDNESYTESRYGEFTYEAEMDAYDAVESFDWDTPGGRSWVEFEAFDFFGAVRVEIFDDEGDRVFDETYSGNGHIQDLEQTDDGRDGEWTIVLTSSFAEGRVYVRVTSR